MRWTGTASVARRSASSCCPAAFSTKAWWSGSNGASRRPEIGVGYGTTEVGGISRRVVTAPVSTRLCRRDHSRTEGYRHRQQRQPRSRSNWSTIAASSATIMPGARSRRFRGKLRLARPRLHRGDSLFLVGRDDEVFNAAATSIRSADRGGLRDAPGVTDVGIVGAARHWRSARRGHRHRRQRR